MLICHIFNTLVFVLKCSSKYCEVYWAEWFVRLLPSCLKLRLCVLWIHLCIYLCFIHFLVGQCRIQMTVVACDEKDFDVSFNVLTWWFWWEKRKQFHILKKLSYARKLAFFNYLLHFFLLLSFELERVLVALHHTWLLDCDTGLFQPNTAYLGMTYFWIAFSVDANSQLSITDHCVNQLGHCVFSLCISWTKTTDLWKCKV